MSVPAEFQDSFRPSTYEPRFAPEPELFIDPHDASLHVFFMEALDLDTGTPETGYPTRIRHWTRACETYMDDPVPPLDFQ